MKTWKTENPPKDGSPIVAIGCVVSAHEKGGNLAPFLLTVHWKAVGDFKGWCHRPYGEGCSPDNGLAIVDSPDDEVWIDFWIELPTFGPAGSRRTGTMMPAIAKWNGPD